jgi:hypothetical protein
MRLDFAKSKLSSRNDEVVVDLVCSCDRHIGAPAGAAEAATVGGELRNPATHQTVGCVAGIDGITWSLLCVQNWRHVLVKTQYWDANTSSWVNGSASWTGTVVGGRVWQSTAARDATKPTWRILFIVKDGKKANGVVDGKAALPWA